MEKITSSVHFQERHTQVIDNMVQKRLSSPLDKSPERQVLGHRMISTRRYRPSEEHALSVLYGEDCWQGRGKKTN